MVVKRTRYRRGRRDTAEDEESKLQDGGAVRYMHRPQGVPSGIAVNLSV